MADIPLMTQYGNVPSFPMGPYGGLTAIPRQPEQYTSNIPTINPYNTNDNVLLSNTTVYDPSGNPTYGPSNPTTTVGGYNQPNLSTYLPWNAMNTGSMYGGFGQIPTGRGTGDWGGTGSQVNPITPDINGETNNVSSEHSGFLGFQERAQSAYAKMMEDQADSFAGGAAGAKEAVEQGYGQAIGLYEPKLEEGARQDIAAQRTAITSGQYNVNPMLTQYQGIGGSQPGGVGTPSFGRLSTPPSQWTPGSSPRAGQPPAYQSFQRGQAPTINPFQRQSGPSFGGFQRQGGPQATAFQRGQTPGISQFQMGQGPQASAFQQGAAPQVSAFQRGQAPQINEFQRGQDPQFTGAGQDGFKFDFQKDPGYQFRMDEGLKAIGAGGSARGNRLSGAADKDRMRFAQGLASEEFGKAYGRQRQEFESDRAMREREAGRKTGFDVAQYQFGTGQDFASQQAAQQARQQQYQFGTGVDVGEQARTQALRTQQQQFGAGLGASEQARVQGAQQQAFQFGTGTQQQALRDLQQQQQQAYRFGTGIDVGERARTDAAARQSYQFGQGMDQSELARQQALQQQAYQFGAGQDFAANQAYQGALQDQYRFGTGQDFAANQAANQFRQNQYEFGQQYGLSANEQMNRQRLAANLQNYNMMNQQQQQQYQRMQGLAGAGREDIGTLADLYRGQGEASANAILGLAAESRLSAAQRAAEKAGEKNWFERYVLGTVNAIGDIIPG
jgi:hypothetical protein